MQYQLRFPPQLDFDLPPRQRKQGYLGGMYIIYRDGQWRAYANRWKANWDAEHHNCACTSAPTIRELCERILKSWRKT